jgi:hypothetical protein
MHVTQGSHRYKNKFVFMKSVPGYNALKLEGHSFKNLPLTDLMPYAVHGISLTTSTFRAYFHPNKVTCSEKDYINCKIKLKAKFRYK